MLCTIVPGHAPGKTLLLSTHIDTVPSSDDYTRDPWRADIEQGRIYGLGVADAKAQIAAFVYAVRAVQMLHDLHLAGTVRLAFVVDEETGACSPYGTRYLLDQGLLDADAALIGEPGDEKIALGHRGVYRFRVTTQGKALHTGLRAWEKGSAGHNAIPDMARLIAEEQVSQTITASLDQAYAAYYLEPLVFVPAAALDEEAEIVWLLSTAISEITGKQVRRAGAGPACDGWMFLAKGIPRSAVTASRVEEFTARTNGLIWEACVKSRKCMRK